MPTTLQPQHPAPAGALPEPGPPSLRWTAPDTPANVAAVSRDAPPASSQEPGTRWAPRPVADTPSGWAPGDLVLIPGALVRLQGLSARPELNGVMALLLRPREDSGRWAVSVGASETGVQEFFSCRSENLEPQAPFFGDTAFPPGIDAEEFQELVGEILSDVEPLSAMVERALLAPRRGQSPDLPPEAIDFLRSLLAALRTSPSSQLFQALRACADCRPAWTALRIAEWLVSCERPGT